MRRSRAPSQKLSSFSSDISQENASVSKVVTNSSGLRSTANILDILNSRPISPNTTCESVSGNVSLEVDDDGNNDEKINNLDQILQKDVFDEAATDTSQTNDGVAKRIFNVVYGKQTKKKHKTWEGDGTVELIGNSVTLLDVDGKILGRASGKKFAELMEGNQYYIGSKEVEVIDEIVQQNVNEKKRPLEIKENVTSPNKNIPKRLKKTNSSTMKTLCRKFNSPLIKEVKESNKILVMPRPDHDHQWVFNTNNSPLRDVIVDSRLSSMLRPHQREGVIFLYRCVVGIRNHQYLGAILADEMGLGKTLQSITLIWTLMKQGPYGKPLLKRVLIVTPSSLVNNWDQEFSRWLGVERISTFIVDQKNKPSAYAELNGIPVLIISYEMFVRYHADVSKIKFDLIICDEGHRLKNTNIRTSLLLNQIDCKRRILLTGTPIQNDLQEFHALVDFVNPGILGVYNEFRKTFEEPIVMSRQPDAGQFILKKGEAKAQELNYKTSGFILRRTQSLINQFLPSKHEAVIFCKPTNLQKLLYKTAADYWESRLDASEFDSSQISHLSVMMAMKKISNHPLLIGSTDNNQEQDELTQCLSEVLKDQSEGLIEESNKLLLVLCLLNNLKLSKEKLVIISYFTQTLDMVAELCIHCGFQYCRLDGSTPSSQRIDIVNRFNSNHSTDFVFLLSGKAGGTGLNLTGASRLVLFDSDWNPASDLQAMARVWRDGQTKSVYIYRLLNTGTIEEKIFQRQLSKASLSETVVDVVAVNSTVRLSKNELKDLFTLHESTCLTHDLMECSCNGSGEKLSHSDMANTKDEESENDCQLSITTESSLDNKSNLRMNQLFHWEHHAAPFNLTLLKEMALNGAEHNISFIFRNVTSKEH